MHPDCVRPYSQPPNGPPTGTILLLSCMMKCTKKANRATDKKLRTKRPTTCVNVLCASNWTRPLGSHVYWACFRQPFPQFGRQQGLHVCACVFVFDICTDVTFTRTTCGSMLTDSKITRRVLGIPLKHIVMLWQSKHTNPLENQKHCAMVVGFCVVGRWRFSERWHFSDSLSAGVRSSKKIKHASRLVGEIKFANFRPEAGAMCVWERLSDFVCVFGARAQYIDDVAPYRRRTASKSLH